LNHKSQITNRKFPSVESQIANYKSQIPECASHSLMVPSPSSLFSSYLQATMDRRAIQ
jgi:hypothetical protein